MTTKFCVPWKRHWTFWFHTYLNNWVGGENCDPPPHTHTHIYTFSNKWCEDKRSKDEQRQKTIKYRFVETQHSTLFPRLGSLDYWAHGDIHWRAAQKKWPKAFPQKSWFMFVWFFFPIKSMSGAFPINVGLPSTETVLCFCYVLAPSGGQDLMLHYYWVTVNGSPLQRNPKYWPYVSLLSEFIFFCFFFSVY